MSYYILELVLGGENLNRIKNETKSSYYKYKVGISSKTLGIMIIIISILNLLFLIPDLHNLEGSLKNLVILLIRIVFSLILIIAFFNIKKLKTFSAYSIFVTALEIMGVSVFLFILIQYSNPNFLIQTLGLMVLIMVIFLVPNKFINMLTVSIVSSIVFFTYSHYYIHNIKSFDFVAALAYIIIAITLCSQAAKASEKHQLKEFQTKCKLEHISSTDHLTNIANRYKLEEEANRWIDFCHNQNLPLSLVFIDIDDFKIINDLHGHILGDFVLTKLTEIISKHLRTSDIIARWGGDEFILLLPNTALNDAVSITEKVRNSIVETDFSKDVKVTCCFGIAEVNSLSNFEQLIHKADYLMYEGKKINKNTINY